MTALAFLFVLPFMLLTLAFTAEIFFGLRRDAPSPPATRQPMTVAIIPANDEAKIIGDTLAHLRAELDAQTRLLVVADNCTDDTAAITRAAGIEVIERIDPTRRGKGYALAFARDHLTPAPPECVVVLDADCAIDRASMRTIAVQAQATGRPVQAIYLLRPDLAADAMVQVSNFAFAVKNLVRQKGAAALSGRVHLTGSGMAFPWPLFATAPLATGNVVEDLVLGLDLSSRGKPPMLAPDALVWSGASSPDGTLKQRTRWEGGFLSESMRRAFPAMVLGIRRGDGAEFWSGLSLAIPPLTLLVLGNIIAILVAALLMLAGASAVPLIAQGIVSTLAACAVLAAWARMGRRYLSSGALAKLPLYLLWKLPLYLGLLRGGPKGWLRPGR